MSYRNSISGFNPDEMNFPELAKEIEDMIHDHLKIARSHNQKYWISDKAIQMLKYIEDGSLIVVKKE